MTIGCLIMLLICDTLIVVSNPDNIKIVSVVRGGYEEYDESLGRTRHVGLPKYGNIFKNPTYIDVYRDYMIIYPEKTVVSAPQLEEEDNPLEQLLAKVGRNVENEYIILILRPGSARLGRFLRQTIHDRNIDVGEELYEEGREIPAGLGDTRITPPEQSDEQKEETRGR
ncbi:MAG: hypothetical protein EOM20_20360 [Spartobacteria bacterium]|nr:hypothetical protein [Spartobacteria bacterium]